MRLTQPTKEIAHLDTPSGLPVPVGMNPSPKFVYVVYPRGWSYRSGYGFLPNLRKVISRPGVNGVKKDGRLNSVLATVADKGGAYISPTDTRLPEEYQGYVQYYETTCGRKWYVDFCAQVAVLPTGELIWSSPEGEWDKFRVAVRDSGIIPSMLPEIYQTIRDGKRKAIDYLAGLMHGNPVRAAEYATAVAELEEMEEHYKSLQTASPPKAIKTRKRRATNIED